MYNFHDDYKDPIFKQFLELSEIEQYEYLTGVKSCWWKKLQCKFVSKWWTTMRTMNPYLRAYDLWESVYKGRF